MIQRRADWRNPTASINARRCLCASNYSVAGEQAKTEEGPVKRDVPTSTGDAEPEAAQPPRIPGKNATGPARGSGKPPLPPQSKPRHTLPHARKSYMVTPGNGATASGSAGGGGVAGSPGSGSAGSGDPAVAAVPPSPMVSSAGLQVALQHFKESARQDRERLAKSVPDLGVIDLVQSTAAANQTWAS